MMVFSKDDLSLASLAEVIFLYHGKETAKIYKEAYKERKSPNQKGGFRFNKAERINKSIVQ